MISPVCCTLPAGSPGFAHGNWRLVSIAPAAFSSSQRDWKDAPAGVRRVPLRQSLQSPALGRCDPSHRREVMRHRPGLLPKEPAHWRHTTQPRRSGGGAMVALSPLVGLSHSSFRQPLKSPATTSDSGSQSDRGSLS